MPNISDKIYKSILDAANAEETRMAQYKQQYNENDAYRLANAYSQYPWINPEILVSTVLSGNDAVLPQLSDYALAQMARAGVTPYDVSRQDDIQNSYRENYVTGVSRTDPTGNLSLREYQKSLRNRMSK
jgi:hypothetical protein